MKHILFICLLFFDFYCYFANIFLPVAEFTQLEDSTGMTISAQIGFDSYLRFSIPNPKQGETLPYTNVSFDNQKIGDGKVHITRMSDGIFSGTFEGDRITEGRFDLKYKE